VDGTGLEYVQYQAFLSAVSNLWALLGLQQGWKSSVSISDNFFFGSAVILSSNIDTLDQIPSNTEIERRFRF
jgi:hypothetical protein